MDEWLDTARPISLYSQLKSIFKNVPVILSSTSPNLEELAAKCGAEAILNRPFDLNDFLELVARQLFGPKIST